MGKIRTFVAIRGVRIRDYFGSAVISSDSVELLNYNCSDMLNMSGKLNRFKDDLKLFAKASFTMVEINKEMEDLMKRLKAFEGIWDSNSVDTSAISNRIDNISETLASIQKKVKEIGEYTFYALEIPQKTMDNIDNRLARVKEICTSDWEQKLNIRDILSNLKTNNLPIIDRYISSAMDSIQKRFDTIRFFTTDERIALTGICQSEVLLLEVNRDWNKFYKIIRKICPKLNILFIVSYDDYFKNRVMIDTIISKINSSKSPKIGIGFISDKAQHREIISAIETVWKGKCYRYPYRFIQSNVKVSNLYKKNPQWLAVAKQLAVHSDFLVQIDILLNTIEMCKKDRITKIRNLTDAAKARLSEKKKNKNIERLILDGLTNSDIAAIIACQGDNIDELRQYVRILRLKLIHHFIRHSSLPAVSVENNEKLISLTSTEEKTLSYIAQGYENLEIALEEGVSKETVKTNRKRLKKKFSDYNKNTTGNPVNPNDKHYDPTLPIINQALRTGLLNLDDFYNDHDVANGNSALSFDPGTDHNSILIAACEDKLITIIENIPAHEINKLNAGQKECFVESLIIRGHENWEIALKLKNINEIEFVRMKLFQLINRITENNSLSNKGIESIKLNDPVELEIIKLIAASNMDDDKNIVLITDEKIFNKLKHTANKKDATNKININEISNKRKFLMANFVDIPITDPNVDPDADPDTSFIYIPKKDGTVMGISLNEKKMLDLIAAGLTNDDIAQRMGFSVSDVINARASLRKKFNIQTDDKSGRTICMIIKSYKLGLINIDTVVENNMK